MYKGILLYPYSKPLQRYKTIIFIGFLKDGLLMYGGIHFQMYGLL